MIHDLLRKIGLTEYETRIYLALLELSESTSGEIMNKSNINSGRIYQILDSLKTKGLISEIVKNGIKYFSPTDPKKILSYLEEKEDEIKSQKQEVSSIIPSILSNMNTLGKDAKIEIYTGFEGLKSAFIKETSRYSKGKDLYVLGVKPDISYPKKIISFFEYSIYPKRLRKKVNVKKINDINFKNSGAKAEKGGDMRYIPYPSITTFNIIDDLAMISIHSGENPLIIAIESNEVSNAFKTQFEALWKLAKK